MAGTTVRISDELWNTLNQMKTPEDKSFEDVIWKALNKKPKKKLLSPLFP